MQTSAVAALDEDGIALGTVSLQGVFHLINIGKGAIGTVGLSKLATHQPNFVDTSLAYQRNDVFMLLTTGLAQLFHIA